MARDAGVPFQTSGTRRSRYGSDEQEIKKMLISKIGNANSMPYDI